MMAETQFHAVVLAGGPPPGEDALAASRGVAKKSLIPLAGKPMVQWVVEALQASGRVRTIVVTGLAPEDGVAFAGDVVLQPDAGGLLDNIFAGVDRVQALDSQADRVLSCSADIPLLTPEVVRYFVGACTNPEFDLYYSVVEREVMEAQFPGSGRTFVPLKDGRFAGGDMYMLRIAAARANEHLARELVEERKNYRKQIQLIGVGALLQFLLRRLDVAGAERVVSKRLHLRGKAIVSPYVELAMDADKPYQLEMIEAALLRRAAAQGHLPNADR
ncbi:MAG: NTP transferase domain-containing protein [Chloroflexi bacterium]|nr:NTP transferase domain-containing protein [Chloroflexota bacterium]